MHSWFILSSFLLRIMCHVIRNLLITTLYIKALHVQFLTLFPSISEPLSSSMCTKCCQCRELSQVTIVNYNMYWFSSPGSQTGHESLFKTEWNILVKKLFDISMLERNKPTFGEVLPFALLSKVILGDWYLSHVCALNMKSEPGN